MKEKNLKICYIIFFIFILALCVHSNSFATINEEITNGETLITLDEDVIEDVEISEERNVTIDLNGHTLTIASQNGTRGFINLGTLTIKATGGGTIRNGTETNSSYGIIDNYGTITIERRNI